MALYIGNTRISRLKAGTQGVAAVGVTEEQLSGGGVAKHITAVDISNDTVNAAHLATGYTAHDNQGQAIVGTMATNPTAEPNDVNFIDYDGTVRYSYSSSEFAALTELPANPSHDGLTAQGWNWTLADAQEVVADSGFLDIGQNYVTSDGKTRIRIYIPWKGEKTITFYINQSVSGSVTFDFGDGSSTETITGTGNVNITHAFPNNEAQYEIVLTVSSGNLMLGYNYPGNRFLGDYNYYLKSVLCGSGVVAIGWVGFADAQNLEIISVPVTLNTDGCNSGCASCFALRAFVVPSGIATVPAYFFERTRSARFVCLPKSVTRVNAGAFGYSGVNRLASVASNFSVGSTTALQKIYISSSVTSIGQYGFYNNPALQSFTVPENVTDIAALAFGLNTALKSFIFKPTTPPTVANSNAWNSLPTTCKIYVPSGTLSDYTSATNYPDSSTYTYVEY